MYRTVLVPLDGSAFAEHALPLALSIAGRAGATLRLVRVHVPVATAYGGDEPATDLDLETPVKAAEYAYLEEVSARLGKVCRIRQATALLEGRIADALSEQAVSADADLVVMTTHGRGPLSRFWLGSVADELVRRLSRPLLLVRPDETAPELAHPSALHHVLIPLDGSALAEGILDPALELGRLLEADFTLLRVIEPVILPDARLGGNAASGLNPVLLQALQSEAQAYLERMAELLRARSVRVQTRVVSNRWAAGAILEEAGAHGLHLIALATHGRSGLARLLLGSVADKVVRGASVPVLLWRSRGDAPGSGER
jgi:nucleotide-binding universal stress UspA family protein